MSSLSVWPTHIATPTRVTAQTASLPSCVVEKRVCGVPLRSSVLSCFSVMSAGGSCSSLLHVAIPPTHISVRRAFFQRRSTFWVSSAVHVQ
jgi:hypothetical protein